MAKKIGILGSGGVAKTLGNGFIKHGYEVMLSSRTPEKLSDWVAEAGNNGSAGTFDEAAAFGEILVACVKGAVAAEVLAGINSDHIAGKTIIDPTNPISNDAPENGVLRFSSDINRSLMEDLQAQFPEAHFVKAFNSIGAAFMVNPQFEPKPTMFICGNDENAKGEVKVILDQFGFETEDMGAVEAARAIEPLCMLWCIPGFRENRWTHAFRLMKL